MKPMRRNSKIGLAALLGVIVAAAALTGTYAAAKSAIAVTGSAAATTARTATATATAAHTSTSVPASTATATSVSASKSTATPTTPPAMSTPASTPATTATVTATSSAAQALPDTAAIGNFPSLKQLYSLSCEYAAASAVTLFWGNQVAENLFVSQVPTSPNPHIGFRGDINAAFGGINDYGVYAEALVPVLQAQGYNATVIYGGVSRLKASIAAGDPVVVWITAGKSIARTPVAASYNGQSFTLVAGEHAVVIYGYDSGGVYIMDVASGSYAYTAWDSFVTRWSYFDQMSLIITPR